MKTVFFIISVLLCLDLSAQNNNGPLFRIIENGKTGYINKRGEVIIKPVYADGDNFSYGLAAVRKDGLYGFIDTEGNYVLPAAYHFAKSFYKDYALTIMDGENQVINKKGDRVLNSAYTGMKIINDNTAIIYTKTKKQGVLDLTNGKLIIDTIYTEISDFHKGIAITKTKANNTWDFAISIIDSIGNIIVKPGTYKSIGNFTADDIAVVMLNDNSQGAIDLQGNLLFTYTNEISKISSDFHHGLAVVKDNYFQGKSEDVYHKGYIDIKGNIVFSDTTLTDIQEFNGDRAFIEDKNGYYLIDRNFKRIGNNNFFDVFKTDDYYTDYYQDPIKTMGSHALVDDGDGWGAINLNGEYIVPASFDQAHGTIDNYFFFFNYEEDDKPIYTIFGQDGKMIKNSIESFDSRGFNDGLLLIISNGLLSYIDEQGNTIWQESKDNQLKFLNVDYMIRGYNYAYSETERYNGWGQSRNYPKKTENRKFPKGKLSLIIDDNTHKIFGEEYKGYAMYLINQTKDTIKFAASDSRLEVLMQAKDENSNWKDIEYAPRSWCGNSYHTLKLAPDEYWEFVIPQYQGGVKTELRAVYRYYDEKEQKELYSNSIMGSVNPAQFFYKLEYSPRGLMDSYND